MENTHLNKVKFFAQYYGQKVWRCELHNELMNVDYEVLCHVDESIMGAPIVKEWLELTPLQNITDEDAIELSKFINTSKQDVLKAIKSGLVSMDLLPSRAVDTLRLKSYAVPYNNVTVEQQIEYGWTKLKKL